MCGYENLPSGGFELGVSMGMYNMGPIIQIPTRFSFALRQMLQRNLHFSVLQKIVENLIVHRLYVSYPAIRIHSTHWHYTTFRLFYSFQYQ